VLPNCDVYRNCKARGVPGQDPLLDFEAEVKIIYPDLVPAPAPWPMTQPTIHTIDTTSRVISFVLGFALASLIAWLGSIPGDEVAATGNGASVASVGTPVVPAAIEEKRPATTMESRAPMTPPVAASSTASAPAVAPRPVAAALAPPVTPVVPPKTVEPAPPSSSATPSRASRPAASDSPAASGYRGGLALTSTPAGAQVLLNGKVVGETPVVLNDLPVGSRAIVVRRDGYSPWSASVRVIANQRTTVRATLTPQSGG
jgi:hypothetical protein